MRYEQMRQSREGMVSHVRIAIVLACLALPAHGQLKCDKPSGAAEWFECRVRQVRMNNLKDNLKQVATEKQASAPSASTASTSLLDRTSGPDLVSAATKLAGFGDKPAGSTSPATGGGTAGQTSSGGSSGDFTVTSSGYSLYAMASGQKQLSPDVYDKGINWRRFFVTVGSETPTDALEKNNGKNRIIGAKFLLINNRDVSTKKNKDLVDKLDIGSVGSEFGDLDIRVREYIQSVLPPDEKMFGDHWNETATKLTPEHLKHIDQMIQASDLLPSVQTLLDKVKVAVRQIRTAPQLSIAYTAKLAEQRKQGIDTHQLEAAFDYGFAEWIGVTLNASYNYLNSPMIGADIRQGRAAGELHFTPNHTQALKQGSSPFLFGLSGEAKWMNSYDSIYKVQLRAEIPITKGISLPISVTHANRADLIKNSEQETVGQFGFTIDVAKLSGLFNQSKQ